jgi:hypothetical protein
MRNTPAIASVLRGSSSSSEAPPTTHNDVARAQGHRIVISVRLLPKTVDALDAIAREHSWGPRSRRTHYIELAIDRFIANHRATQKAGDS